MDAQSNRKARGAFFTPAEISRYFAQWAIQFSEDVVLEPSCGEASFLLAAGERLRALDASPLIWSSQLQGVEIHEDSAIAARSLLQDAGLDASVTVSDFFDFDDRQKFDAIVGNPPFVRYQQFSGAARTKTRLISMPPSQPEAAATVPVFVPKPISVTSSPHFWRHNWPILCSPRTWPISV